MNDGWMNKENRQNRPETNTTLALNYESLYGSLGFWIPWCEPWIPGTGFKILPQWILDSRMWSPLPRYWIQDSTSLDSWFYVVDPGSQVLDSRFHLNGFWIPGCGVRFQGTGFKNPPHWIPDIMLRILDPRYWIPNSTYGIPDSKELDSEFHKQIFSVFRTPRANISWIPEFGLPNIGHYESRCAYRT